MKIIIGKKYLPKFTSIRQIRNPKIFILSRKNKLYFQIRHWILFLVSLVLLFSHYIKSQPQNLHFEHFTTDDGLSQGYITSIVQDKLGYLWIGTQDGLNKYDGYEFTEYKFDENDSTTISDNWVTSLAFDYQNNLWVGTAGKGVTRLSQNGNENIRFPFKVNDGSGLNCEFVSKIIVAEDSVIWFATWGGGLNSYHPATGKFHYKLHNPDVENSLSDNRPSAILEDSKGYIWLATYSSGIDRYDVKNNKVKNYRYSENDDGSLIFDWVSALFEDNEGILWIGTYGGGLDRFNYETENFSHFNPENSAQFGFRDSLITQIFQDSKGLLWIGTDGGGIYLYDREENYFHNYKNDPAEQASIGDNRIWSIYEDKIGNIWFGGFSKGLSKYDKRKNWFKLYRNIPYNKNSLRNNFVKSIVIDRQNQLWVGHNKGITVISRKDNQYRHIFENEKKYAEIQVRSICIKSKEEIWIGTWGSGLIKYNSISRKIKQYLKDDDTESAISSDFVRDIYLDSNKEIWICTTLGLNKYDQSKDGFFVFRHDDADSNSIADDRLYVFFEDKFGNFWIGSANGLDRYNEAANCFEHFKHSPNETSSLSHNRIRSIYQDSRGILWIGTFGGGLNKFDYDTHNFISYKKENGLPNDVVYEIIEDDSSYLWLSTNNGLSRFDPVNETFYNYSTQNGLQGKEFNGGAVCKADDGEIFFGGANGMNSFYLSDITKKYDTLTDVIITKFSVLNESITVKSHPEILHDNINYVSAIRLEHDQNFISFEFAALDFSSPSKNLYKYRLTGLEEDWNYVNVSRRYANYTNLEPGEYIFSVIASNNDGIWSPSGISLNIMISPPWWLTWWANSFYILLTLAVIISGTIMQKRKLKVKNEIRMKELENEKLKEIFQMKSKFYDNISHEFRTPLTLIMGPIKRLYGKEQDKEIKNLYMFILKNSQKLLKLISELLYLSKLDAGQMKLNAQKSDIVSFTKAIFLSFRFLAAKKNITLHFYSRDDLIWLYFDREKMSQIITNLITNAVKYTPDGGRIEVFIEENSPLNEVIIKIKDNGIGISKNELPRIYERFFQTSSHDNKIFRGTGIGLSLTKELVNMHRGQIIAESELNKGTTFILSFKLGKEHLLENEIIFDNSMIEEIKFSNENVVKKSSPVKINVPLILVVEDDDDMRDYIMSLMQDQYDYLEAANGDEGIKKALKYVPDLIVSDLLMPVVDGLNLCQNLKSNIITSHIPIILLTAKSGDEEKIKGLRHGADDFIAKPFSDTELLIRIKNLIDQRKKLRERYLREAEIHPADVAVTSLDKQFIQGVIDYLENNISKPDFSVNDIIEDMSISRSQLYRKFSSILGEKPNDFIRKYRIKRAAKLIEEDFGNITQVAYEVGFNDISYFTKCFKQVFNQKPLEYKRNHIPSPKNFYK